MINLILACASDAEGRLVIGKDGKLPWRVPAELKSFMLKTLGCPIVMGRKTYESLPRKPLPERQNIVLTKNSSYSAPDCAVITDPMRIVDEYNLTHQKCYIIGGEEMYRIFLPWAKRIYISKFDLAISGDTYAPFSWDYINQMFLPLTISSHTGTMISENSEKSFVQWKEYLYERGSSKSFSDAKKRFEQSEDPFAKNVHDTA